MRSIESKWLTIKPQHGPMKEVGENGCHMQDVVRITYEILRTLDSEIPCEENKTACHHLMEAYNALCSRKAKRLEAGTLGYSE